MNFACPHLDQCSSSAQCVARLNAAMGNQAGLQAQLGGGQHSMNRTHAAADVTAAELERVRAKLKRYEEREPLVQALLTAMQECPSDDAVGELCGGCFEKFEAVRDFKLE